MWYYLYNGGICMWPILLCSIFMIAVILERWQALKSAQVDTGGLMKRIEELLNRNDVGKAVALCESTPGPVAEIIGTGLKKYRLLANLKRPQDVIEAGVVKAMEDHGAQIVDKLEQNLVILASVASLAPLFGFLGTVTGMIGAFNAIASAGSMKPDIVAGGISEALITTAAGLFIAAPAYTAYNYYTTRVQKFVLNVQSNATDLIEIVIKLTSKGVIGTAEAADAVAPPRSADDEDRTDRSVDLKGPAEDDEDEEEEEEDDEDEDDDDAKPAPAKKPGKVIAKR